MSILDDAVKDAVLLQEAATKLAQERIVSALAPKIKQMVESKLLNEEELELSDILASLEDDSSDDEEGFEYADEAPEAPVEMALEDEVVYDMADDAGEDHEEDDEDEAEEAAPAVSVHADGDVNIDLEIEADGDDEEEGDEVITGAAFLEARNRARRLVRAAGIVTDRMKSAKKLSEARAATSSSFKIRGALLSLSDENILTNDPSMVASLQEAFTTLTITHKELENKMRRRLSEMKHGYGEMDEMEELDELDAVLALTPEDDEEAEMLGDLDLADLDITVDVEEEEAADEDEEAADELALDLDMDDEDEEAADEEAAGDEEAMDDDDEILEIDENVLRNALAELRRERLSEDAAEEADQFGGGEAMGDVIEVDEETLVNVLADELGRVAAIGEAAPAVAEARRRRARRVTESRTNETARRLAEATRENDKLKKQLQEMNLFSAKLLYVNKLFEGRNVTAKQRRAIVEAMDNAKTLREAKLLYRSLSQSLNKKATISESRVRVLGSSSRSTPSAQPANNGVEVDRWATLAGLNEGK